MAIHRLLDTDHVLVYGEVHVMEMLLVPLKWPNNLHTGNVCMHNLMVQYFFVGKKIGSIVCISPFTAEPAPLETEPESTAGTTPADPRFRSPVSHQFSTIGMLRNFLLTATVDPRMV